MDEYTLPRRPYKSEVVAGYIFPFTLTFTSNLDYKVYPRLTHFSWHSLFLNLLLTIVVMFAFPGKTRRSTAGKTVATLLLGVYIFIPFIVIKNN